MSERYIIESWVEQAEGRATVTAVLDRRPDDDWSTAFRSEAGEPHGAGAALDRDRIVLTDDRGISAESLVARVNARLLPR